MAQYRCTDCEKAISNKYGRCSVCNTLKKNKQIERMINRKIAKTHNTIEYGIGQVKKHAEGRFWSSSHKGCFRCSFGKSETPLHRDTKYQRWVHHREAGRTVFCELRLKDGMGRPDLIIIDNGFVWIEEIVVTEKEASLIKKKNKYPWELKIIYARVKNGLTTGIKTENKTKQEIHS